MTDDILDVAGLGAGPFNLSIAALLTEAPDLRAGFFDAKPAFSWHPGMMLPDARLQTSHLKDLVSGVSPTNPNSFLNYLVRHKRFYQFLCAELPAVSRREYADYLAWVAGRLDTVHFGHRVETVTCDDGLFTIRFAGRDEPVRARNLILGTGLVPRVPHFARHLLGDTCFHNSDIARRDLDLRGRRVAVVGGGQSGAEVVERILAGDWGTPAGLHWLSRRPNLEPLDEVAFSNEYFTPQYVDAFYPLDRRRKQETVARQKLASDGISPDTLRGLYRTLYERRALGDLEHQVAFLPARELLDLHAHPGPDGAAGPYRLDAVNHLTGEPEEYRADVVVFCTGFEHRIPDYLAPLAGRLARDVDQPFVLDRSFRVAWDGPEAQRIYAVNAGRHSHGIAEPQMSLMCWRSATIINDLAGRTVFDTDQAMQMVQWTTPDGCRPTTDLAPRTRARDALLA